MKVLILEGVIIQVIEAGRSLKRLVCGWTRERFKKVAENDVEKAEAGRRSTVHE